MRRRLRHKGGGFLYSIQMVEAPDIVERGRYLLTINIRLKVGKRNDRSGKTAAGHSRPSMWQRALYPHSPLGLVARLGKHMRAHDSAGRPNHLVAPCTRGICPEIMPLHYMPPLLGGKGICTPCLPSPAPCASTNGVASAEKKCESAKPIDCFGRDTFEGVVLYE